MTIANGTRPYVYRVYDTTGDLIYIGSTVRLWHRLSAHRSRSWWAPTVGKVRAQLHPTTTAARTAERRAILAEKPRWNRYELKGRVLFLPQQQFHDFVYSLTAYLAAERMDGGELTIRPYQLVRLAKYGQVYQDRFGVPLDFDLDSIDLYAPPPPLFERQHRAA